MATPGESTQAPTEATERAKAIPEIKQLKADVQDLRIRSESQRTKAGKLSGESAQHARDLTALRERIPAGTGILGLKEDLDEAVATGDKQLHDWGVVFSELVARISSLEGVVLKLTDEREC